MFAHALLQKYPGYETNGNVHIRNTGAIGRSFSSSTNWSNVGVRLNTFITYFWEFLEGARGYCNNQDVNIGNSCVGYPYMYHISVVPMISYRGPWVGSHPAQAVLYSSSPRVGRFFRDAHEMHLSQDARQLIMNSWTLSVTYIYHL